MSSMIITYDLKQPGRNYNDLHSSIKHFPTWARITESTWFIKTNLSCAQVRDKLLHVIDRNDRLFVAKLPHDAAWHNVIADNAYLQSNI